MLVKGHKERKRKKGTKNLPMLLLQVSCYELIRSRELKTNRMCRIGFASRMRGYFIITDVS
jgi:hypothetical protein